MQQRWYRVTAEAECVVFEVAGKPPKKDSATSMWNGGEDSRERIDRLRSAAVAAMKGRPPFKEPISLEAEIEGDASVGDLDNVIGGILDALQSPPPDGRWKDSRAIAFEDDAQVTELIIRRRAGQNRYRVTITPLNPDESA